MNVNDSLLISSEIEKYSVGGDDRLYLLLYKY